MLPIVMSSAKADSALRKNRSPPSFSDRTVQYAKLKWMSRQLEIKLRNSQNELKLSALPPPMLGIEPAVPVYYLRMRG